MTINLKSRRLIFEKEGESEIEITKFDITHYQEATPNRAKAILHFYGGRERYNTISSNTQFSSDGEYCLAWDEMNNGLTSPPLQEFPTDSPLDLVKKELKKDDSEIKGVAFFSDGNELSKEQIKQIKEDQKNVVRLAVKKRLTTAEARQFRDDEITQQCFANKEAKHRYLDHQHFGLMSSYIAPTTFYLNQSGKEAGKKAETETRAYITGFGYPVFDNAYYASIVGDDKKDKEDELKAIFKQQIYAVLLSRQQQINDRKIKADTKVPLILNRAYDFIRFENSEDNGETVSQSDKANKLQEFVNKTLVDLFLEQEVANAIKGKIDKVLFLDGEKQFKTTDRDITQGVKFFGDIADINKALNRSGSGVEALNIDGHDMISLAKAYHQGNKAMIAIPIMANPQAQDGEGSMKGLGSAEESLNVAMGGMMQMLLNGNHNTDLKSRAIEDSMNLARFNNAEKADERGRGGGLHSIDSNSQTTFQDNLKSYGVPIGVGLAGAGVAVLCASALGLGIVSAPVVATAVVVGLACSGATAVTLKRYPDFLSHS